jgi:hypothetical protein
MRSEMLFILALAVLAIAGCVNVDLGPASVDLGQASKDWSEVGKGFADAYKEGQKSPTAGQAPQQTTDEHR